MTRPGRGPSVARRAGGARGAAAGFRGGSGPFAERLIWCMLRRMSRFLSVLLLVGLAGLGGLTARAEPGAGPAPEPRFELFSRGPAGTAVLISKTHLEAIKLATPVVVSDTLTITHAGVGYFEKEGKSGPILFRPSSEVPFKAGQGFGWVLKVDSSQTQVPVEERFTLPKPNGTWTVDPDTTKISDDGLSATTTEVHAFWDFLWRVWTMEEGDPAGPHSFDLSVAGKPVAELKFTIKKK